MITWLHLQHVAKLIFKIPLLITQKKMKKKKSEREETNRAMEFSHTKVRVNKNATNVNLN